MNRPNQNYQFINKLYNTYCNSFDLLGSFYTEDSSVIYSGEKDTKMPIRNNFKLEIKKLFGTRTVACVLIMNINKLSVEGDKILYNIIGIFTMEHQTNQRFSHVIYTNKDNKIITEVLLFLDEIVQQQTFEKSKEYIKRKNLYISHPEKKLDKDIIRDFSEYGNINGVKFSPKGIVVEFSTSSGFDKAIKSSDEWVKKGYQSVPYGYDNRRDSRIQY